MRRFINLLLMSLLLVAVGGASASSIFSKRPHYSLLFLDGPAGVSNTDQVMKLTAAPDSPGWLRLNAVTNVTKRAGEVWFTRDNVLRHILTLESGVGENNTGAASSLSFRTYDDAGAVSTAVMTLHRDEPDVGYAKGYVEMNQSFVAGVALFGGDVVSYKACASGYVRRIPNYCARDITAASAVTLARDTCTLVTKPVTPTVALILRLDIEIAASNVAGARTVNVDTSLNTCTSVFPIASLKTYEGAAVPLGTIIAGNSQVVLLDATSAFYLKFGDDASNTGTVKYTIDGYFD